MEGFVSPYIYSPEISNYFALDTVQHKNMNNIWWYVTEVGKERLKE